MAKKEKKAIVAQSKIDYPLDWKTTAEIEVPPKIIDQVIGQESSAEIIRKAAAQKRNMLLVGLPGTGKCLAPGQDILLGNGDVCPIETLYSNTAAVSDIEAGNEKMIVLKASSLSPQVPSLVKGMNEKFWIKNAGLSRISKESYHGKLFSIRTASGRKIRVTPNHKLLAIDNNGFLLKEAKHLSLNDFLAVPRRIHVLDEKPVFSEPLPMPPQGIFRKINAPTYFDTGFAIWLGHLMAEGSFCRNQVRFTSTDQHRRESFKKLTHEVFGIKPYMKGKDVFINSVELLTYLREIFGLKIGNAREKELPAVLMRSQKRTIKSFLSRFFADDGTFSRDSVELACSNEKIASQLAYLLLHFGVVARIKKKFNKKTNWTYYHLFIQGSFLKAFLKNIGFADKRKNKLLQNYLFRIKSNTNVDIVPFIGPLLKKARLSRNIFITGFEEISSSMISRYENNKRFPSRTALKKIVEELEKRICLAEDDQLPMLKSLANSNLFWDKIIEIAEEDFDDFVYDIEVDSKTHLFIAGFGGIISHNSMLAQAMAEILPVSELHDILVYPNHADPNNPKVRVVKAGKGKEILQKARLEAKAEEDNLRMMGLIMPIGWFILSFISWQLKWIPDVVYAATIIAGFFLIISFALGTQMKTRSEKKTPKLLIDNAGKKTSPFFEATGARAGSLLGDVRHDPLQSFYGFNELYLQKKGQNGAESVKKTFNGLWSEMFEKYGKEIIRNEKGHEAIMLPLEEKIFTLGYKDGKVALSRILSINRQPFNGELVELKTSSKAISLTPEHIIDTLAGEKEAGKVSKKDNLITLLKMELARVFN